MDWLVCNSFFIQIVVQICLHKQKFESVYSMQYDKRGPLVERFAVGGVWISSPHFVIPVLTLDDEDFLVFSENESEEQSDKESSDSEIETESDTQFRASTPIMDQQFEHFENDDASDHMDVDNHNDFQNDSPYVPLSESSFADPPMNSSNRDSYQSSAQ